MTMPSIVSLGDPQRRRILAALVLTLAFGLASTMPAAAAEAGTGAGTGTETEIDAGDPDPVTGTSDDGLYPFCARAQDGDFDGTTNGISAQYTVDAEGTYTANDGSIVYEGPLTITITTNETFFFGPQGTHYGQTAQGNDCGNDNLGPNAPVPATITITGSNPALGGFVNCGESAGEFWRVGDNFHAEVDPRCDVMGNVVPGTATGGSAVMFEGLLQPPCNVLPAYDCLTGAYTQT